MARIIYRGCGGIDGFCNVMHVFYGACEVIVGGYDGEAIGWCCCGEEFADIGDKFMSVRYRIPVLNQYRGSLLGV